MVKIVNNQIYNHKVLHVNYTTYDMWHADIMLLSGEDHDDSDCHPYWYAWVLGIYHAEVCHDHPSAVSSDVQVLEFLWVCWLGQDANYNTGSIGHRLHLVGFVLDYLIDFDDPTQATSGAFNFIDPVEVIWGVHLIPAFAHGKTDEGRRTSLPDCSPGYCQRAQLCRFE